jgi:multicomponent Na+:H+ antiporter subunit B
MFKFAAYILFPIAILFAIYIQVNGEASPGGGFQAGAIFASLIVGYDLIFSKYLIKQKNLYQMSVIGVLIYIFIGILPVLFGNNFLDYNILSDNHKNAQSMGIFIIELGVFGTVSAGLSIIYFALKEYHEIK